MCACTYTAGFVLTNIAFGMAAAAYVETVKAAEPTTSLLVMATMTATKPTVLEVLATVPIVLGVALASTEQGQTEQAGAASALDGYVGGGVHAAAAAHVQGLFGRSAQWGPLLAVLASNLCFSLRAMYAKRARALPGPKPPNAFIYLITTLVGVAVTLPWSMLQEGGVFSGQCPEHGAALLDSIGGGGGGGDDDDGGVPVWLLVGNGIMYYVYNQTSFVVLSKTEMLTHTQINAVRRVFIVVVATTVFDRHMSSTNAAGVALAFLGLWAYLKVKRRNAEKLAPA